MATMPAALAADKTDKKSSREREALRRAQQQVQTLQQEKNDLAQREAALGAELSAVKERAGTLNAAVEKAESQKNSSAAEAGRLRKELAAASVEKDATLSRLKEAEAKIAELSASQSQAAEKLKANQATTTQLKRESEQKTKTIQFCEDKNRKLYQLNVQLLDRFNNKTALDAVLQAEPFTQLKKVEVENLLQEYRDKIDAERVVPESGS